MTPDWIVTAIAMAAAYVCGAILTYVMAGMIYMYKSADQWKIWPVTFGWPIVWACALVYAVWLKVRRK